MNVKSEFYELEDSEFIEESTPAERGADPELTCPEFTEGSKGQGRSFVSVFKSAINHFQSDSTFTGFV